MKPAAIGSDVATRPKKQQNHANIPCPIENCARFTYGKLPDHLTKRHGLVGAERDAVNERQRKRFFNGELCQVRYLRESALATLWGEDYTDPQIRQKVLDSFAMVKVRIIPLAACTRNRPLTAQDANILTDYNARVEQKTPRAPRRRRSDSASNSEKRRKSCESSEGEENAIAGGSSPAASEIPPDRLTVSAPEAFGTTKLDGRYKHLINDLKKPAVATDEDIIRTNKHNRSYRKYAKRLLAYLVARSTSNDADELLGDQKLMCDFIEQAKRECKPKSARNYLVAAIKMLDCRLANSALSAEKFSSLTNVYRILNTILREFVSSNFGLHLYDGPVQASPSY